MISTVDLVRFLEKLRSTSKLLDMVRNNLNDANTWFGKLPSGESSFWQLYGWIREHEDFDGKVVDFYDMLDALQAVLTKHGFDRWVKAPEDGGIPF